MLDVKALHSAAHELEVEGRQFPKGEQKMHEDDVVWSDSVGQKAGASLQAAQVGAAPAKHSSRSGSYWHVAVSVHMA